MDAQQKPDRTSRRQIIEEARQALEAFQRLMADTGMTRESCMDALRRTEGRAAAEQVQRQAAEVLRLFEQQTQRDVFHLSPAARGVPRRLDGRRII